MSERAGGETRPPDSDRDSDEPAPLTRLDPDAPLRAATADALDATDDTAGPGQSDRPRGDVSRQPVVDTRRYRWMIGIFGLALVVAVSVYQFASHGVGTTGVPPGKPLHYFAAPLADSDLNGDPNLNPPCTQTDHDPRALNVCLLVGRTPLVLAFFVPGSSECERQVDALQTLSRRFPASAVRFAAVAIHAGRAETERLARLRHWTIPVAYDRDGSVGGLYGVEVCPMAELAYRGGIVKDRLIGDRWQTSAQLLPRVQALLAASRRRVST